MNLPRRIINLIGTLLVLITLIAGTFLMAMPVVFESFDLKQEEREVAESNALLQAQIDALAAKQASMDRLEADLAALRDQLPASLRTDDVTRISVIAAAAAAKSDGYLVGIEYKKPEAFAERTLETVVEAAPDIQIDVVWAASDGKEVGESTDGGDSAASTEEGTDAPPSTSTGSGASTSGKYQIPVTIKASVPNMRAAFRFADGMRAGPRLFQVTAVLAESDPKSEDEPLELTIQGLIFVSLA